MKSAPIKYHRATSVEEAVQLLSSTSQARLGSLAGGQNLVAMLNMRLWRLTALIDVNAIPGLSVIEPRGNDIVFGALTRHAMVEHSEPGGPAPTSVVHDDSARCRPSGA